MKDPAAQKWAQSCAKTVLLDGIYNIFTSYFLVLRSQLAQLLHASDRSEARPSQSTSKQAKEA